MSRVLSLLVLFSTALFWTSSGLSQPSPNLTSSPLQIEERKILIAPQELWYELTLKAHPSDDPISFKSWRQIDIADKQNLVIESFYLLALRRSVLLTRNDPALVNIVNKIAVPAADLKTIALEFESEHKRIFGSYPDSVPVNVEEILHNLLSRYELR